MKSIRSHSLRIRNLKHPTEICRAISRLHFQQLCTYLCSVFQQKTWPMTSNKHVGCLKLRMLIFLVVMHSPSWVMGQMLPVLRQLQLSIVCVTNLSLIHHLSMQQSIGPATQAISRVMQLSLPDLLSKIATMVSSPLWFKLETQKLGRLNLVSNAVILALKLACKLKTVDGHHSIR